jgi:hypothetical protein
MKGILSMIGASVGGWLGWWLGMHVGLVTAFVISTLGGGVGIYATRRGMAMLLE